MSCASMQTHDRTCKASPTSPDWKKYGRNPATEETQPLKKNVFFE